MDENEKSVQRTRSWAGFFAVTAGDIAIAGAAVVGVIAGWGNHQILVAVLTAAFTAVSTLTTAYFGIRAATNTAQQAVEASVSRTGSPSITCSPKTSEPPDKEAPQESAPPEIAEAAAPH